MQELKEYPISLVEVIRARSVVRSYVQPSQLIFYESLSRLIGARVYVKHENHNPTGSFKIRGGVNLMHSLRQGGTKGVITFSTGNHGLSVATAARWFGLAAVVVVPRGSNPAKTRAIVQAGAELIEAGETFEEASEVVQQLSEDRSLYYVHPANEPMLINGVGTQFLDIVDDLPDVETVIVPLGAGSEAAAAVTTLHALRDSIDVVAVQAEKSSAAFKSWKRQEICQDSNTTFAGGFATGIAYETPFQIYKNSLADFVLLGEEEIYDGIALSMYHTHNLAEGAGASTIMAAWKMRERLKGRTVVLQMSGCNTSPEEVRTACNRESFRSGVPEDFR